MMTDSTQANSEQTPEGVGDLIVTRLIKRYTYTQNCAVSGEDELQKTVWLKVGAQSFCVTPYAVAAEDAPQFQRMLAVALRSILESAPRVQQDAPLVRDDVSPHEPNPDAAVPREPTEPMMFVGGRSIIDGAESRPSASWAEEARLAWIAMYDAAIAEQTKHAD